MTLAQLIEQAGDRDLSKTYPKSDGNYVWDYKLQSSITEDLELHLIVSDTGKAGFKDKVSVHELVQYVLGESDPQVPVDILLNEIKVVGVEGLTMARI